MFSVSPSRNANIKNHRVYLPGEQVGRTHHSVVTAAVEAKASGEPVNGIIRSSSLTNILNLVDSIPVDYIHSVSEFVVSVVQSWRAFLHWQ